MMKELTYEKVKQLFDFNTETGQLIWKKQDDKSRSWNSRYGRKVAGSCDTRGYVSVRILGKLYYAHHLIWLWVYGYWPEDQIDHIDGYRWNNRIDNLREASHSQNKMNTKIRQDNSLGVTGIYFATNVNKYHARIQVNNEQINLGYFSLLDLAIKARKEAEEKYFGDFAYTGNLGAR